MARVRRLGWDPDSADDNDRDYAASNLLGYGVPRPIDLSEYLPRMLNQGDGESCVLHGAAVVIHGAHRRQGHNAPELMAINPPWWRCRREAYSADLNTGTSIRRAFRMLAKHGFCRETYARYSAGAYAAAPAPMADLMSADQRSKSASSLGRAPLVYRRLRPSGDARIAAWNQALQNGHLILFGASVSRRFATGALNFDRPILPPSRDDDIVGGHAMVCYGADVDGNFMIRNSWGERWGMFGDFIMAANWTPKTRDCWIATSAPYYSDRVA